MDVVVFRGWLFIFALGCTPIRSLDEGCRPDRCGAQGNARDGVDGGAADGNAPGRDGGPDGSAGQGGNPAFLSASPVSAFHYFGTSAAFGGNARLLAVGASPAQTGGVGSGALYVFARAQDGLATYSDFGPPVRLSPRTASEPPQADNFGGAVVLSQDGRVLVASASEAQGGTGAVYAFANAGASASEAVWSRPSAVEPASLAPGDRFGFSLALSADGQTLAVGATGVNLGAGAAYLFTRSGAGWTPSAELTPLSGDAGDAFGSALALSADGTTLAVGANDEDSAARGVYPTPRADDGATDSGAVHVFTYRRGQPNDAAVGWTQSAYLKASNTGPGDRFGRALALSADGQTLAVGASHEDSPGAGVNAAQGDGVDSAGAVYLFAHRGDGWLEEAYVKATNPGFEDWFGHAVSLDGSGTRLAVGAPGEDSARGPAAGASQVSGSPAGTAVAEGADPADNSALKAGAVYLFARDPDGWVQSAYLKAPSPRPGDRFGSALALSGGGQTLGVGAIYDDGASPSASPAGDSAPSHTEDAGAIYVYEAAWP